MGQTQLMEMIAMFPLNSPVSHCLSAAWKSVTNVGGKEQEVSEVAVVWPQAEKQTFISEF